MNLRPFCDSDIALMERWLSVPPVARWYNNPDHWLNELRDRQGEFSFLTHCIAEVEGVPIGFCQYYDTFFTQKYEAWDDEPRVGKNQGEIYSIDYLIGEPQYLRQGFGKAMIEQMLERMKKLGAKTVIVKPEKENTASGLALVASGFVRVGTIYYFDWRNTQA